MTWEMSEDLVKMNFYCLPGAVGPLTHRFSCKYSMCQSTPTGDLGTLPKHITWRSSKNHPRSYLCESEIAGTRPLYSPIDVRGWHTAECCHRIILRIADIRYSEDAFSSDRNP